MGHVDEIGNQYGRLLVLERAGSTVHGAALWLCQCECEKKTKVRTGSLHSGHTKSCGCMVNGAINEVGNRHGLLVVIGRDGNTDSGKAMWRCLCDCGNEVSVMGQYLRNGHTKSCGCWHGRRLPDGIAAMHAVMCGYRTKARSRDLPWKLTEDQFVGLTTSNCYYCGAEPEQVSRQGDFNGDYIYNGIDRIDNSKGYMFDNCVPCCRACNVAKGERSLPEFLEWIDRIHYHVHEENLKLARVRGQA